VLPGKQLENICMTKKFSYFVFLCVRAVKYMQAASKSDFSLALMSHCAEKPNTVFFFPVDAVHTLTCALMLLNTDLHGQVSNV